MTKKKAKEAAALKPLTSGQIFSEVKIASVQLRLENRGPGRRILRLRGSGRMSMAIALRRAEKGRSVSSRRAVVRISGLQVRHSRVIAGEFEHKAMAVAMSPHGGPRIRTVGDRRIVHDGTALSIAGEAEIRRQIGAGEVKCRVSVAALKLSAKELE